MIEEYKDKILIVDDNPENIKVIANILKDQGYKLAFAQTGAEALKILENNSFDLILLDIMMPQMDGCEVCERLKANIKTQNIPIIFITAKDQVEDERKGLELGAVDYITKPIEPTITLARVKTHLELNSLRKKLEVKVQEETAKRLTQQKLLLKQSRLAAMGEMLRAITHQWKQPLGIAMLVNSNFQLELDEENTDKEKLKKYSTKLYNTINFLSQTIDDFKNYFSIDKNKMLFNIKKEVEKIVNMLEPQLSSDKINIYIDIDDTLEGYGVTGEFKHVILNLISNAKDSILKCDKESKNITISATKLNHNTTQINIQDSGKGICETILEKIFDDEFTTKQESGTGIGLSMCKLIVEEEMKGEIKAKNNEDGTLFSFTIPSYKN